MYDPIIARWYTIDNVAEKGYNMTPYNYTFNNPMKYIDPDGNWPWEKKHKREARKYKRRTGGTLNKHKGEDGNYATVKTTFTTSEKKEGNLLGSTTITIKFFKSEEQGGTTREVSDNEKILNLDWWFDNKTGPDSKQNTVSRDHPDFEKAFKKKNRIKDENKKDNKPKSGDVDSVPRVNDGDTSGWEYYYFVEDYGDKKEDLWINTTQSKARSMLSEDEEKK